MNVSVQSNFLRSDIHDVKDSLKNSLFSGPYEVYNFSYHANFYHLPSINRFGCYDKTTIVSPKNKNNESVTFDACRTTQNQKLNTSKDAVFRNHRNINTINPPKAKDNLDASLSSQLYPQNIKVTLPQGKNNCSLLSSKVEKSDPVNSSLLLKDEEISGDKKVKKRVSFKNVQVREYDTVISHNPSCKRGPPIELGWKYDESCDNVIDIEDYEEDVNRSYRNLRRYYLKNDYDDLLISYYQRKKILVETCGYSIAEIRDAMNEVNKAREERRKTILFLPMSKVEEIFEDIARSFGIVKST